MSATLDRIDYDGWELTVGFLVDAETGICGGMSESLPRGLGVATAVKRLRELADRIEAAHPGPSPTVSGDL